MPSTGSEIQIKENILKLVLDNAPYDGWSRKNFNAAVEELGLEDEARNIFPNGIRDLTRYYFAVANTYLEENLNKFDFSQMSIRERIKIAIEIHLEYFVENKESVRKIIGNQIVRGAGFENLPRIAKTIDIIWRAAGDESTDFNYYTKRILLLGVYISTFLYWLDEKNKDRISAFIDRRIADVMQIQRFRNQVGKFFISKNGKGYYSRKAILRR